MKNFVRILSLLLLVCALLAVFAACDSQPVETLVIYNWADYIYSEDKLKEDFGAYYSQMTGGKQIEITYVTFDTNETMLTRLTKGDSNVDVVCPSEYAIQKLIEMDMLMPLNYFDEQTYKSKFSDAVDLSKYVHNADNVEEGIRSKVGSTFGQIEIASTGQKVSMLDYFVPYMYGTLGILYNKYAFMDAGIYDEETLNKANWGILFNDDGNGNVLSDKLSGNILMKDSIRDSYAATVFYLLESDQLDGKTNDEGRLYTSMSAGELINEVDDNLLELVKEALTAQKQQLFGYEVDFGKDDLLSGNAIVDLAWSGDAMYAVEESWNDDLGEEGDYELSYYVPHSTGNIWFDGWVVPKQKTENKEHLDAVKLFINFLNRPDIAAQNLYEIGYSAAVKPQALLDSPEAMAFLAEGYDYDPDDPEQMEQFTEEFFHYEDEIDHSNWRYPFVSAELNADNYRNIDSLGVMRDFGDKNHDVVTAWNYSRSVGVTTWPLLGWTALAVAAVVGAVFAVIGVKRYLQHRQKEE